MQEPGHSQVTGTRVPEGRVVQKEGGTEECPPTPRSGQTNQTLGG